MIKRLVNMKTMALYDIHSKFFNELNDTNDNDNDDDFIIFKNFIIKIAIFFSKFKDDWEVQNIFKINLNIIKIF